MLTKDQGCNETTLPAVPGSVFATMALPLEDTGLPLHINGDFWLASDRRSLWDDEGQDSKVVCQSIVSQTSPLTPAY